MNLWKFDANGIQILYNDIFKKKCKKDNPLLSLFLRGDTEVLLNQMGF